jgi:hypothetical protein
MNRQRNLKSYFRSRERQRKPLHSSVTLLMQSNNAPVGTCVFVIPNSPKQRPRKSTYEMQLTQRRTSDARRVILLEQDKVLAAYKQKIEKLWLLGPRSEAQKLAAVNPERYGRHEGTFRGNKVKLYVRKNNSQGFRRKAS